MKKKSNCLKVSILNTVVFTLSVAPSFALQTTGYSSTNHDRFLSGYPTTPVENPSPSFVGQGLNWAGVGWDASNPTKSYGFLSPQHYLVATHYGGSANVQIFANSTLQTRSQWKVEGTGFGPVFPSGPDISLGTLNTAFSANSGLPRYGVLDLNSSSTSNTLSAYLLPSLLYGRGIDGTYSTRVGQADIVNVVTAGAQHYFATSRTTTQLEGGDSGSPAVYRWTNPAGAEEIALLGNHAGIDGTFNYSNFIGTHQVMASLNSLMNDDGFALRVVGNPVSTWAGTISNMISNGEAWGLTPPTPSPVDVFVNFNGSIAGSSRVVSMDVDHNLRGLYFLPTASTSLGFSFDGGSTLTIGRGGVTNYDASRQVFQAPLALGAPQMWNGGAGGITAGNVNNNGHLLEITTQGTTRINGIVSGSGGFAVSDGRVELNEANIYSGNTWVHGGKLMAGNISGSATGLGSVTVAAGGILAGGGTISGNVAVNGSVAPGDGGIGTLSSGSVTWHGPAIAGSMTDWQFDLGSADQSDLLQITGNFNKGIIGAFRFDFMGSDYNGAFTLVTFTGTSSFSSVDFSYHNLGGGRTGTFTLTSGSLDFTAIPEPSTSFVGFFLLIGLLRRHRS